VTWECSLERGARAPAAVLYGGVATLAAGGA